MVRGQPHTEVPLSHVSGSTRTKEKNGTTANWKNNGRTAAFTPGKRKAERVSPPAPAQLHSSDLLKLDVFRETTRKGPPSQLEGRHKERQEVLQRRPAVARKWHCRRIQAVLAIAKTAEL